MSLSIILWFLRQLSYLELFAYSKCLGCSRVMTENMCILFYFFLLHSYHDIDMAITPMTLNHIDDVNTSS